MKPDDILAMLCDRHHPEDLLELCAKVFPQSPGEEGYSDQAEWICSAAEGSVACAYLLFGSLGQGWLVGHLGQNRATGMWDCNLLHPHLRDGDGMVVSYAIGGAAQDQPDMAAALLFATLAAMIRQGEDGIAAV
ncbi:hypothetical protein [Paracoccus sp. ME4]|uniref:hypothetical protein n=1 Tax=Paracoccus sp. ME4 TaxID=3138066 RepID=UPI00398B0AE8